MPLPSNSILVVDSLEYLNEPHAIGPAERKFVMSCVSRAQASVASFYRFNSVAMGFSCWIQIAQNKYPYWFILRYFINGFQLFSHRV